MAFKWVRSKFLGRGSYGFVFRAECALPYLPYSYSSPRTVAIKSSLERFSWSLRVERAVLYALRGCKEIVHCFEHEHFTSIERGQRFYNIVLEYANGGTLGQLLKSRGGCVPEYEASWYACMLLKGLAHVHGRGYVHCDMKPENVLVFITPSGECKGMVKYNLKLADFGVAKRIGGVSSGTGHKYKHRGALIYSSPESVMLGVHEAAMDVWSLGCIVLEMLPGQGGLWSRCTNNDDGQCLAEMIGNYEDDKLSLLLPEFDNLSVNAKDFVTRCLAKNVEERWTAQQLLKHPFITQSQNQLEVFESQCKMMKYQSNIPFNSSSGSSHISLGMC